MKLKKILSLVLAGVMALCVTGCVNQHPEETTSTNESREVRLVATSPAVVQICNRLDLDLVGICQSTSDLPERYGGVTTVGMAMNPDLEIIKSLDPDYILSPATLQNDLQPKYASIGVSSLFLNLKSVEGMYASIEGLGEKFGREEEAAVMLEEKDLNAEALSNAIDRIMSDDLLRASMHSASLALGKPNASEDILNWCDEMKR